MIFFDLDGTLFDFQHAEGRGIERILEQFSTSGSMDANAFQKDWRDVGNKHFSLYLQGVKSFDAQQEDRMVELFSRYGKTLSKVDARQIFAAYLQEFKAHGRLFGDVMPCLQALRGHDRLGIISNGNGGQQRDKLKTLGILDFFEVVAISDERGVSKPDPDIFRWAVAEAGSTFSDCALVGDSLYHDVYPSAELGMRAVWIHRGGDDAPPPGNIPVIDSLEALPALLFGTRA